MLPGLHNSYRLGWYTMHAHHARSVRNRIGMCVRECSAVASVQQCERTVTYGAELCGKMRFESTLFWHAALRIAVACPFHYRRRRVCACLCVLQCVDLMLFMCIYLNWWWGQVHSQWITDRGFSDNRDNETNRINQIEGGALVEACAYS